MTPEKPRILLVDDEVDFTGNLSIVLGHRGFLVEAVADGLSALSLIAVKHYDVVVLDIKMPGMSGIQVLSEIKRFAPSTAVILLTGHFSTMDEEETLSAGAYAYLLKPYPINRLLGLISAACGAGASEESRTFCPL